jgi:diadenosine tetraphosphate (Ap4A) HIT family hydrolase
MRVPCPFCVLSESRIIDNTELTTTIRDAYPVAPGHTLIITNRHVASFFDITEAEQLQLFEALDDAKIQVCQEFNPDGFNIGINEGQAAGQTVMHLHLHLIPRYQEDNPDPRGGIRWIFPDKADYWSKK